LRQALNARKTPFGLPTHGVFLKNLTLAVWYE
jgi:hypothetical protein